MASGQPMPDCRSEQVLLTLPLKVDGLACLQLTAKVCGTQGLSYDVEKPCVLLDVCDLQQKHAEHAHFLASVYKHPASVAVYVSCAVSLLHIMTACRQHTSKQLNIVCLWDTWDYQLQAIYPVR